MEIYCDLVPKAAHNFLALAAADYYQGCKFHRSIPGFMVQTGDPSNTGKGGESIHGGLMEDDFCDHLRHDRRGVVSFAGNGPGTIGSQFFILYDAATHLDNQFSVFGQIMDGESLNVLDRIEAQPVTGKKNRPVEDIFLKSITINANPLAK